MIKNISSLKGVTPSAEHAFSTYWNALCSEVKQDLCSQREGQLLQNRHQQHSHTEPLLTVKDKGGPRTNTLPLCKIE